MMPEAKKMRAFRQNKLWRSKVVAQRQAEGSIIHVRSLADAEFDEKLRLKLIEEAAEVDQAQTRAELLLELADVSEVIETLCTLHGITKQELVAAQTAKRERLGGFAERLFVEKALHPEGSPGLAYCLADPQKYPEEIE